MATFDPEKFEDKYVFYLQELEGAYKAAFETMNERFDSDLVHAIDQCVLNDSEPVYAGDGTFRIELPDDALDRLEGGLVDDGRAAEILKEYVDRLEDELAASFEFER